MARSVTFSPLNKIVLPQQGAAPGRKEPET
jgi:hypothetical protein